jgi:ParB-like chromosome segregation protein Spo0J
MEASGPRSKKKTKRNSQSNDDIASEQAAISVMPARLRRKEWHGKHDIILVPIDDIIIPKDRPKPDPVLVANIAESIEVFGLIHPIAVRRTDPGWGKERRTLLIAGYARLEAHRLAGESMVPCTYFDNDDDVAEFVRRSENLFRKNHTVLEEAEQIAQLVLFLQERQIGLFGQNVQKQGRPLSVAGKAATLLPIKAKTQEGRKKKIERALAINGLWKKEDIKAKGLDNNEAALLEIAKENTPYDQYKAVVRLARRRSTAKNTLKERMTKTMTAAEQGHYEPLLAGWAEAKSFQSAWRQATSEHKERFINEVLRGPSSPAAWAAARDLVERAFCGRKQILVQDLLRLGVKYGFREKTIHDAVKHLKYRKKRRSWNRRDPWYYINSNSEWKNQLVLISEKEFEDHSPPKPKEEISIDWNDEDDDDRPRKDVGDDSDLDELDD